MSNRPEKLDRLQRWLLSTITHPGAILHGTEETILPSRRQSAQQRLAVYQHAYFARLLEVLREMFPCARFAVGDEAFEQFCVGYLDRHPPYSYTLAHLADQLADYLDQTRPADWGGFLVELFRLEHAIDRVFDAPGPENLPPLTMPAAAAGNMRLLLVPGFELHGFGYPVSAFYTDWKARRRPAWPDRQPQFVALLRRDYIVRRYEISATQYELLLRLSCGAALSEAIAAVAESADWPLEQRVAQVHEWFAFWATERFFASFE